MRDCPRCALDNHSEDSSSSCRSSLFLLWNLAFSKAPVHVVYEDKGSDPKNIFTRGHEKTHALERFDHLHLLQEKIEREGFKIQQDINPFYQGTEYRESRVNIGGLYAILRHGYSPSDVEDFHPCQNPLIIKSPVNI